MSLRQQLERRVSELQPGDHVVHDAILVVRGLDRDGDRYRIRFTYGGISDWFDRDDTVLIYGENAA